MVRLIMNPQLQRSYERRADQLRPIKISSHVFGYAPGSVLFELGNTKVLCAVSLQVGVPPFLKGTKTGWLTAEYAMLPTSGHSRLARESTAKRNDRAIEISRLIGRSLRAVVDLNILGERTIMVDCDVLQADGSTRTAAITGSFIALKMAVHHWLTTGDLAQSIITDEVAAVSAGFAQGLPLLDLDYTEDSTIDADYNFVLTRSKKIIEIQGAAEKNALSWDDFEKIKTFAIQGVQSLFTTIDEKDGMLASVPLPKSDGKKSQAPLFSLKSRLANIT